MKKNRGKGPGGDEPGRSSPAELVLALRGASRALQTFLTAQARASGLGLLEFLTLERAAEGDGVTPREAGRALGLGSSTMTGLSARLEQDGLVRREPHPTDRRLVLIRATPQGRELVERATGSLVAALVDLAEAAGSGTRADMRQFIDASAELLAAHARTPPAPRQPVMRESMPRRPKQPPPLRRRSQKGNSEAA